MWLIVIFLFILSKPIAAAGEFKVSQSIVFDVDQSGLARVNQNIKIINNLSQIYPKEYQISLTGSELSQIKGNDTGGDIAIQNQTSDDTTTIKLTPNAPGIGKDQTTQINLSYLISNFAKKKGNTWEIQVPQYQNLSDGDLNISLKIPPSFGQLSFSSAPAVSSHDLSSYTEIKFNQNSVKNKILLVFGNHQLIDFSLKYFLENSSEVVKNTEIAIPPDTNNQIIHYRQFSPQPQNIKLDADGNWLARYQLAPQQKVDVEISGQAKITSWQKIPEEIDVKKYLTAQKFWEVDNDEIKTISATVKGPKQIYDYVVNNLNYNFSQIDGSRRHGALFAVQNQNNALCTEFTDLFVALSRSQNIPAREIEGYALSNNTKIKPLNPNSDILHAWPQYYDQTSKSWISVDPTWEKTTNGIDYFSDLDLNHLTFVIHGISSVYPPPPGSYRSSLSEKTITTDFATEEIKSDSKPLQAKIQGKQLSIYNPNLFSLNNIIVNINGKQESIRTLPPLSQTSLEVPTTSFLDILSPQNRSYHVSIISNEIPNPTVENIINRQYYLFLSLAIAGCIVLLSLGGIIVTVEKNS